MTDSRELRWAQLVTSPYRLAQKSVPKLGKYPLKSVLSGQMSLVTVLWRKALSKEIAHLAETILTGKTLRFYLGEHVDTKEFAQISGLAGGTVRSMVRRGQLPPQELFNGNRRVWKTEVIFPYFVKK